MALMLALMLTDGVACRSMHFLEKLSKIGLQPLPGKR